MDYLRQTATHKRKQAWCGNWQGWRCQWPPLAKQPGHSSRLETTTNGCCGCLDFRTAVIRIIPKISKLLLLLLLLLLSKTDSDVGSRLLSQVLPYRARCGAHRPRDRHATRSQRRISHPPDKAPTSPRRSKTPSSVNTQCPFGVQDNNLLVPGIWLCSEHRFCFCSISAPAVFFRTALSVKQNKQTIEARTETRNSTTPLSWRSRSYVLQ